jgi:glycosyltransferase involved in cell wall biosynthesis
MADRSGPVRVLYSFPHRIGASRICTAAWYQVAGASRAGARVVACPASVQRALPAEVDVRPTLSRGRWRIPYRSIGAMRAFWLHDQIIAKRLEAMADDIDLVHAWPLGSLATLKAAKRLGIPSVLERPNAHTRFAYRVVQEECDRIGVTLPPDHEHAYKEKVLVREEAEYELATKLLCPSDFVLSTFVRQGFSQHCLARHQYGFDADTFYPDPLRRTSGEGLVMAFVGGCAPRKGLHFALEAWVRSRSSRQGRFLIVGDFVPGYREMLSPMLSHRGVEVLGHRSGVADLMRQCDVLVLPSIEEGSALVTSEARGCGCVLLVSEAAGAVCRHMEDGLIHAVGDVEALAGHMDLLDGDPDLLVRLRNRSLEGIGALTWDAAGEVLHRIYRTVAAEHGDRLPSTFAASARLVSSP